MTIFEALREDHDIQRDLVNKLIETSGNSDDRILIFHKLKNELALHANAEERYFYTPLIKDDMTQEKARHGIAEHHELDELVEKLETTAMSSPGWLVTAKELAHKVKHHLEDEEKVFFQLGGKVIQESKKTELGKQYLNYMEENRIL